MAIEWIAAEDVEASGAEEEPVLLEQTPDYYPEFAEFMKHELERGGGELYFRGATNLVYHVARTGSDEPDSLPGIAVSVRLEAAGATLVDEDIDRDLWGFLEWIAEGVGGDWSLDALRTTGAIYKVPGAPERT